MIPRWVTTKSNVLHAMKPHIFIKKIKHTHFLWKSRWFLLAEKAVCPKKYQPRRRVPYALRGTKTLMKVHNRILLDLSLLG
jgi:hypothetical protein